MLVLLSGCATTLTPGAEKVRIVDRSQVASCERVKLITASERVGTDKPGNAMKAAMNEAAAAGANSLLIVSTSMNTFEGASVVAEAFSCK